MNNKGFTLIELILVIAILAILALISTPNVIKIINKNKVDDYNSTIDSILQATKLYVADNRYDLSFDKKCSDIGVTEIVTEIKVLGDNSSPGLIDEKYLQSPIKNYCTDKDFTDEELKNIVISVTLNCNTKQFSYAMSNNNTIFKGKIDSCS